MGNLSISKKITLWYSILTLLIFFLLFSFIYFTSDNLIKSDIKKSLATSVDSSIKYIEYSGGKVKFDDKLLRINPNIDLSIYDKYGNLLFGDVPRTFNIDTSFKDKNISETTTKARETYFYYDNYYYLEGFDDLWIRGVTSISSEQATYRKLIKVSTLALPFLLLFVLLGGYFLTKKSLEPIEEIRLAAEEINEGRDLNKRLNLRGNKDEIHRLANTFDSMFNRLEESFLREKQFTSDISHELRTPISIVILEAENLLSKKDIDLEDRKSLEKILYQSQKMKHLINQMLKLTRAENNKVSLDIEKINLSEIVEIIVEEQAVFSREKNITIYTDIDKDIYIDGDREYFTLILINLISNSIKYGKENGYIKINADLTKDGTSINIIDNGIGIDAKNIDKIWDRLYQVSPSRSYTNSYSLGLGLALVKWALDLLNWKVEVKSKLKEGTSFSIIIPKWFIF